MFAVKPPANCPTSRGQSFAVAPVMYSRLDKYVHYTTAGNAAKALLPSGAVNVYRASNFSVSEANEGVLLITSCVVSRNDWEGGRGPGNRGYTDLDQQ